MSERTEQQGRAADERGYQQDDTSVRAVAIFFAGLTVAVIVVMIVVRLLMHLFEPAPPPDETAFERETELPPHPRLQERPIVGLEQLRRREEQRLNSYGWVDREKGVVRIPIERAMELVVDESETTPDE